jgi:hypothetical protein
MWQTSNMVFGNDGNKLKCIHEEIKKRLNLGNTCYHALKNILSSCLQSENIKIKIPVYKTIILTVVLYGCETWS